MAIEALILGGVLIAEGEPVRRRAWERRPDLPPGQLDQIFAEATGPAFVGERTEDEIRQRIALTTGSSRPTPSSSWRTSTVTNTWIRFSASWLPSLRLHHPVAALSNAGLRLREVMGGKFATHEMVDLMMISAEVLPNTRERR